MGKSLTQKLIEAHLVSGSTEPGAEVALRIDQTLTQDATGTMAYLEFESMGIDRVRTKRSVAYVDHNNPALKTPMTTAIFRPLPQSTASGSPVPATASVIRSIWSASAFPERP